MHQLAPLLDFLLFFFFFSSRRRHTRYWRDWSSDVCSSDLLEALIEEKSHHKGMVILGDRFLALLDLSCQTGGTAARATGKRLPAIERNEEIGRASCRERV